MAVAFDAASESHTGTTGSASQASFNWTHTPVGTPRGVLVFTFVNANADNATAVSYGSKTLDPVSGGRAVDTAGEPGDCKAWFYGGNDVPTGAQTVTVTRTNNANVMYAVAFTVTALGACEVHTAGIVLLNTDGTLAQQNVTDGSPGSNSLRFAGVNSGLAAPPVAGASSTLGPTIDFGARVISTVRETTAGQGSRAVGFSDAGSDDRAAVHLAVKEATFAGSGGGTVSATSTGAAATTVTGTGAVTASVTSTGAAGAAVTGAGGGAVASPSLVATAGSLASAAGGGSLSVSASGAAELASGIEGLGGGTIAVLSTGQAAIPVTGQLSRSLTLSAAGQAALPVTGSGQASLSLSLLATADAPVAGSGTGSVQLSALGTADIPEPPILASGQCFLSISLLGTIAPSPSPERTVLLEVRNRLQICRAQKRDRYA